MHGVEVMTSTRGNVMIDRVWSEALGREDDGMEGPLCETTLDPLRTR
jgi:hypothetical protein